MSEKEGGFSQGYSTSNMNGLCREISNENVYTKINTKRAYFVIKRGLDVIAAAICLVIFAIPMLIIGIAIHLDSPGPILFRQDRVGRNGYIFVMYKFRSLKQNAPDNVATRELDDMSQYTTRVGEFLRKTSLDELPQIINILRGDMSFVGYRPVVVTEYRLNEMRRDSGVFQIRPGITGYAQINGRDNINDDEKLELDIYYLKNYSFSLDVSCLFKTIRVVISQEGVN